MFFSLGLSETDAHIYMLNLDTPYFLPHTNTHARTHAHTLAHRHRHTLCKSFPLPHHLFSKLSFSLFSFHSSSELDSSLFRRSSAFSFMLFFYRTNWLHHFWTSLIFLPLLSHQTFFCQLILSVLGLRGACLCFTLNTVVCKRKSQVTSSQPSWLELVLNFIAS